MFNLIVTEKPSVARTISKVLGVTTRRDVYLEGGGYLMSWCVGHLVELASPGVYDPRFEHWDRADLPILPERWQYLVSSSTKNQFDVLCKLMHRPDVDRIVCATDAGREGELIFRLLYHQCNCRKPVSRLWISSMEDSAIQAGFANLKPSTEYDSLYKAALCRERADWLVGINATRLFSCLHGVTLNVGRVMTPTLAMTVEREAVIASFHPEPFYTVLLQMEGYMASSERFKENALQAGLLERAKTLIDEFCAYEYASQADFSDLSRVNIAYTTVGDEDIPLQVHVDLEGYKIERELDGRSLDTRQYSSLHELIENELEGLDFQELVAVDEKDIQLLARREVERQPRASVRERLKQVQEKAEKKPSVQAAPKKKVPER